jgi:uncharacterized membrane protein YphA (DoxX/SURF4 family)
MKDFIKKNSNIILIIALIFILPMFIWSGVNKILNFDKKVKTLGKKLSFLPKFCCDFGMVMVIILEIIGSLILLYSAIFYKNRSPLLHTITNITLILFILFLIVVTFIYHPPGKKMIPFMSNMCDIGAFILLLCLFNL